MSKEKKKNKRFEIIENQGFEPTYNVIRDNETGVLYIAYNSNFGVGITVLVDQNGKPLVDNDF
ncbi:DUF6440 family protein [Enterococcus eurekensis]|uniref:DUF6440 family protein n=1 Tax=Enterococcus eurekensis TaxID=1159753 RepID=A0ABV9M1L4_9ENTE